MAKKTSQRKINRNRYQMKRIVIGGLTVDSRRVELKRQIDIWKKKGWIFEESDKRCLIAKFWVPKEVKDRKQSKKRWTRKKKLIIWAISMWFLLGYVLMQMEAERARNLLPATTIESPQR